VEKAIEYARRAGDRAVAQLAYEEGARMYRLALDLLDTHRPGDERGRCELLLGLGEAERRTGDVEAARQTIREAAEGAKWLGAVEQLDAAMGPAACEDAVDDRHGARVRGAVRACRVTAPRAG